MTNSPPMTVHLSPEAAEARRLFHNDVERRMAADADLDDVQDIASKVVSQTVKVALIIHLLEVDPADFGNDISLNVWQRAQRLGEYHLSEAVGVQRLAGEYRILHDAQRLLDWIREKRIELFTIKDICQRMSRPRPGAAQAKEWCQILEDHHWIRSIDEASGRRSKTFETNPALFSQTSQEG